MFQKVFPLQTRYSLLCPVHRHPVRMLFIKGFVKKLKCVTGQIILLPFYTRKGLLSDLFNLIRGKCRGKEAACNVFPPCHTFYSPGKLDCCPFFSPLCKHFCQKVSDPVFFIILKSYPATESCV